MLAEARLYLAIVALFAVAALVPAAAEAQTVSLEPGTLRVGEAFQQRTLESRDPTRCRDICSENETCRSYSFRPATAAVDGLCVLFSDAPRPQADACCTSGVKTPERAVEVPRRQRRNEVIEPLDLPEIAGTGIGGGTLWATPPLNRYFRRIGDGKEEITYSNITFARLININNAIESVEYQCFLSDPRASQVEIVGTGRTTLLPFGSKEINLFLAEGRDHPIWCLFESDAPILADGFTQEIWERFVNGVSSRSTESQIIFHRLRD